MNRRSVKSYLSCILLCHFICLNGQTVSAKDNQDEMRRQYDLGHFDRAAILARSAIKKNGNDLTAHYFLGNILVKQNLLKEAAAQYSICVRQGGARRAPEADYAQKALEQIRGGSRQGAEVSARAGSTVPSHDAAPLSGSTQNAEHYIQEQTAILRKEQEEKLTTKRNTLNEKIRAIEQEVQQQIGGMRHFSSRRVAQQEAQKDYQEEIRAESKKRIELLKSDFEREAADLTQSYDRRIEGLTDYHRNMENQRSH